MNFTQSVAFLFNSLLCLAWPLTRALCGMCVRGLERRGGGAGQGIGGRFLLFLLTKQNLAALRQKDTGKAVHRASEPWPCLRVCVCDSEREHLFLKGGVCGRKRRDL